MKVEQTECSETLAYKIQTPRNYPEESIQQNQDSWIRATLYLLYLCTDYPSIKQNYLWRLCIVRVIGFTDII